MSLNEDKENVENLMKKPSRIPPPKSAKQASKSVSETPNARVLSSSNKSKSVSR